jgi:hypothetical protein
VKNGSSDTVNGIADHIDFANNTDDMLVPAAWFICAVNGDWRTNGLLD